MTPQHPDLRITEGGHGGNKIVAEFHRLKQPIALASLGVTLAVLEADSEIIGARVQVKDPTGRWVDLGERTMLGVYRAKIAVSPALPSLRLDEEL